MFRVLKKVWESPWKKEKKKVWIWEGKPLKNLACLINICELSQELLIESKWNGMDFHNHISMGKNKLNWVQQGFSSLIKY